MIPFLVVIVDTAEVMRQCKDAITNFAGIKYSCRELGNYQCAMMECESGRYKIALGTVDEVSFNLLVILQLRFSGLSYILQIPTINYNMTHYIKHFPILCSAVWCQYSVSMVSVWCQYGGHGVGGLA